MGDALDTRAGSRAKWRDHGVFVGSLLVLGVVGAAVALAPERNAELVPRVGYEEAARLVDSGEPSVILFSVTGCRYCSASRKFLKQVAAEAPGKARFAEVDLEDALELGERFDVTGVPTVLVLRDGKVKRRGLSIESVSELDEALRVSRSTSGGVCTASNCEPKWRRALGAVPGTGVLVNPGSDAR